MSMSDSEKLVRSVADRTIELRYRTWNWGEGVAQYALFAAGAAFAEARYISEVESFMRDNAALQPGRIDEIMPSLAAVLLHERTGDPLPLELAGRVATMLESHPRSHHGAYTATPVRTVWVDYIFETAPFLYHLARITGERRYEEWAIDQTLAYLMACWNPRERLFHHVYYDAVAAPNPFLWARANGWTALGLVEMLDLLPAEYGLQPMLSRILRHLATRLAELQDESGHWHTVLLDTSTYLEAATTAMISLALRRAVRAGWLDTSLDSTADLAWQAVERSIDDAGNVTGVSAETPPGDADDYQATERGVYPWGQGFVILAGLDRLAHGA
jgi:unsaturated rhamnogalacturonyl hydrolase